MVEFVILQGIQRSLVSRLGSLDTSEYTVKPVVNFITKGSSVYNII